MPNFGALTDHFELTGAGGVFETIGELVASSETPVAQSRADAADKNGDITDSAWHGNTTAGLSEASCTYAVKSGTLDTSNLELGQLSAGIVVTSIEVATSNGAWPQVTVSGILGSDALEQVKTYALPLYSITGKKQAQLMGIEVTTGNLTDCSMSASCDWAQQEDGEGEPVAYGVSGAVASASATAVATSEDSPVLAAAGGWTLSQGSGLEEPQAAWHTASMTVEQVLTVSIDA